MTFAALLTLCTIGAACQDYQIGIEPNRASCESRIALEEPAAIAAWNGSDDELSRYLAQYNISADVYVLSDIGLSCKVIK